VTPAAAKAMYARQMAAHGEAMTLTQGAASNTIRGRIIRQKFDAITDTVQQTTPRAVILADGMTITPQKGDVLMVGEAGYMVDDVDDVTARIAGVVIAYGLTLAGS